jgi:hypothetical protein
MADSDMPDRAKQATATQNQVRSRRWASMTRCAWKLPSGVALVLAHPAAWVVREDGTVDTGVSQPSAGVIDSG